MIDLKTDPSRCIFSTNTGVTGTIYSYENQLTLFLDYKDNISIQILCPLIGPDGNPLPEVVNNNNNNNFGAEGETGRIMKCKLARRESIANCEDIILISSIEYKESRSERSLDILVEQPECGKPSHLFGCTNCRAHVLKTFV